MKEDVVDTVRRLGHGLVELAQNRLKLLQAETADELDRLGALLARQMLTGIAALLTVQALALVVVAAVWDTPWRLGAMIGLTLLGAGATAAAHASYVARKRRTKPIFADTLDELEKDRQALEKIV